MSTWFILWLLGAGGIGLFWIVRCVAVEMALRNRQILSSLSHDPPCNDHRCAPKLSIVLAAKDEEDNIEVCVTSLLDQDYPNYELIVVDDRSEDRTSAILERLGGPPRRTLSSGTRLRVVTVKALRDGWFGKNNAMREGVAVSSGEWLLFTDADCRQISRNTLSMAVCEALAHEVDFLSVTPVLETKAMWERIIQPVCSLTLILWFLPERVNNPENKTAYANGAFMLMRRSCYDAIGGHSLVRTEVNEDVCMARFAKRMGLRLRVVENDDLYRTRMYETLGAAWHGWSRIFYGCLRTMRRLLITSGLLILLSIVPWICLMVALLGYSLADPPKAGSATPWMLASGAWLAAVVLSQVAKWRVYRILRIHPLWSLTYLLGAIVTLGILINAMFKVIGATTTTWRGTTYRGDRLVDCRMANGEWRMACPSIDNRQSTIDNSADTQTRAFAIGTGHVFQSVGLGFLFGACCFWSFSGRLVQRAAEPTAHWMEHFYGDRLPAASLTIGVITSLIGGIGLVGVGIGLHGERPSSGRAAMVITAIMAAIYWGLCVLLVIKTGSWVYSLTAAAFGLVATVLFLLAAHSAAVLRRFPPPPDQNVVTDEFLEQHRRGP